LSVKEELRSCHGRRAVAIQVWIVERGSHLSKKRNQDRFDLLENKGIIKILKSDFELSFGNPHKKNLKALSRCLQIPSGRRKILIV
jgi:hypothetical protein